MSNVIYLTIIAFLLVVLFITYREEKRSRPSEEYRVEKMWEGPERREFKRIPSHLHVDYAYLSPDGIKVARQGGMKKTDTQDISWGGLQLLLPEKFKEGTWLSLEIYLKEDRPPIHAVGEVVWIEEALDFPQPDGGRLFRTGMKFREFSSHSQDRLIKFLYEEKTT